MARKTKRTTPKKKTVNRETKKTVGPKPAYKYPTKPKKWAEEIDPVEMLKSLEGAQTLNELDTPKEPEKTDKDVKQETGEYPDQLQLPFMSEDYVQEPETNDINSTIDEIVSNQAQLLKNSENFTKQLDKISEDLKSIAAIVAIMGAIKTADSTSPEDLPENVTFK